jgi:hypothetical protein
MAKYFLSLLSNFLSVLVGTWITVGNFFEGVKNYPYSLDKMLVLLNLLLILLWLIYIFRHYKLAESWIDFRRAAITTCLALLLLLVVIIHAFFDVFGFLSKF